MFAVIVLLVLLQAITVSGVSVDGSECKTYYTGGMKWVCKSCYEGSFHKREGQSFECVKCDEGCVSCWYSSLCTKCYPGRYGQACEYNCSEGCMNNTCEQLAGLCACKEDFTGETCAECVPGRYGPNCTLQCNFGCLNNYCDKSTGECSCNDGFTGLNCSQCIPGRYGPSCQFKCSIGCKEGVCDRKNGHCSCKTNYSGEKCNKCTNGQYGINFNCTLQCPSNCVSCKSDRKCSICKPGHYGLNCQLSCHPGCLLGNCTKVSGHCQDGACEPGYEGARCDYCKATGKPGKDCSRVCMKNCMRCSTNTSMPCDECMKGYWGSDCTHPCLRVCKGIACNKYTGSCWLFGLCALLKKYKIEFSKMCP